MRSKFTEGPRNWEREQYWDRYFPVIGLILTLSALAVLLRLHGFSDYPLTQYRFFFELIVAAFVVSVLRNEIGITTYGIFGPVIIAFLLIAVGPFWGTVLFLNLLILSLSIYHIIQPLRIGTTHRLGTMLMVVAVELALLQWLGQTGRLSESIVSAGIFFPAIITAWYSDRIGRDIDERGWTVPSIRILWTLVAITAAYLAIAIEPIVTFVMENPEAWVAVIAANIYLGSAVNVRLKEYHRFSPLRNSSVWTAIPASIAVKLINIVSFLSDKVGSPREYERGTDFLPMNVRNRYIKQYNPRFLEGMLDKADMKRAFHGTGVSTPDTYRIIESTAAVEDVTELFAERDEFVIKPAGSYGGEGIIVVTGREADRFTTSKGLMRESELLDHIRQILRGQYAEMGLDGTAIIEERIHPSGALRSISGQGVPDIRVIVFMGYPIMAMTRLPTEQSDGAANIHLGAVSVGLSIAEGEAMGGYHQASDSWIDEHPDTGRSLREFKISNWEDVLETAVRAAGVSRLGYAGADIVLDEKKGPVILEINTQPGLGIQNTTLAGILPRLEFLESLPEEYEYKGIEERIALARRWDAENWGENNE